MGELDIFGVHIFNQNLPVGMMKKAFVFIALSMVIVLFSAAQPGALDLSFNPGSGGAGTDVYKGVYAIAQQSDKKILAGGSFTSFNGNRAQHIVRLNTDGSVDTTFKIGSGASGPIRAVALLPNGQIMLGGDFRLFDSISATSVLRLNSDGSLDTSFNSGGGFNDRLYALAIQPDGKILCGGWFTEYNGSPCNRLARLHSNGALDTSFHTALGASSSVHAIVIEPDSNILIGGDFTSYDGDYCMRVARVKQNGRRDSSFTALPGASAAVTDIALRANGKMVIGGNFITYDFQSRNRLAGLLSNGGLDPQFYVQQGADHGVSSVEVLPNGNVLFAGGFRTYQNDSVTCIAMADSYGYIDPAFNEHGSGINNAIVTLKLQTDGKILIGGYFTSFNGEQRNHIARLYNCLTPQPDSIYGLSYALCSGAQQTFSVNPIAGATKYEWTLPSGWMGSSDSASITAISNGSGGTISVKAFTDSCGYSYATTRIIETVKPAGVDICLVTVDSASTHNIVIWEKQPTALIDSFFIYRETTTNVYTKIGAVPYDSLSEYHDLDTTANPNTTSYRYKLSVLDTCGAESALSPYHSTIHLQNLGSGNFQWTFYQIENSSNPVTSFNVNRDAFGNGNFSPIGNIPGTNATYYDNTHSSFLNAVYLIDVNWSISCEPSRRVSTSRSNIKRLADIPISLSSSNIGLNEALQIYPNPATSSVTLSVPQRLLNCTVTITDITGRKISAVQLTTDNQQLSIDNLAKGIYTLVAETNEERIVRKLVVE